MKKKLLSIVLIVGLAVCALGLFGCDYDGGDDDKKQNNEIALTLDNYNYYLTITSQYKSGGVIAGGTYRYSSYDVFISGAVMGIYQDCVLYLANGNKVSLNVAGNAQTTKSIVNGEDSFNVVRVEGTIILY